MYFYILHFVLLLYGGFQLLSFVAEVGGSSSTYTMAGLFVVPAVILSSLRMSIGRIALAFMAVLGIVIVVVHIASALFSEGVLLWNWLFDLALFGYVWHLFRPTGKWQKQYSKLGVFSKEIDPINAEGIDYMERIRQGEYQPYQVQLNFMDYCEAYLVERGELNERQAELLVRDPELGKEIDNVKKKWLWEDIGLGNDVDAFLLPKRFDAPEMKRINLILDRFALEYPERESRIIEYLKSIGYF